MMEKIMDLWVFLNGKKTNIGATVLLLAVVLSKVSGIWEIDADWILRLVETLEWAGGVIAGTGLIHKGAK